MSLRVVTPDEDGDPDPHGEPVTMAEAIVTTAAMIANKRPTLAMFVWEDAAGKVHVRGLPHSVHVCETLARHVAVMLKATREADEDE